MDRHLLLLLLFLRLGANLLNDGAVVLLFHRQVVEDVDGAGLRLRSAGAHGDLRLFVMPEFLEGESVAALVPPLLQHLVGLHHHVNVPTEEQRQPGQAHEDPHLHQEAVKSRVVYVWVHTCNIEIL